MLYIHHARCAPLLARTRVGRMVGHSLEIQLHCDATQCLLHEIQEPITVSARGIELEGRGCMCLINAHHNTRSRK